MKICRKGTHLSGGWTNETDRCVIYPAGRDLPPGFRVSLPGWQHKKNTGWDREEEVKHTRETIIAYVNECRKNGTDIVLRGADLSGLDLRGLDLRDADLRCADLRWTDLRYADLRGADLRWTDLRYADLQDANLRGADLRWADLRRTDLRWANLQCADLRDADLRWTDLRYADLRGADLRWTDLRYANLRGADLRGADLDYCGYELSCKTIGIIADSRLVSQLLYHLCQMDVQACPEWDELRNDERVIALANQAHVIREHGLPEIEPQAQEEK